ncbi:hypothetical protein NPIL_536071 [Nephila pilipes]|uniref:Uncharacterized protein n=1 Tax=Nephila pilipes TaxID=299642 RepID=A0A8X6IQG2_NEPPI|nr:hypothetical protein NPIL_536071 [Nephila pilipes]
MVHKLHVHNSTASRHLAIWFGSSTNGSLIHSLMSTTHSFWRSILPSQSGVREFTASLKVSRILHRIRRRCLLFGGLLLVLFATSFCHMIIRLIQIDIVRTILSAT